MGKDKQKQQNNQNNKKSKTSKASKESNDSIQLKTLIDYIKTKFIPLLQYQKQFDLTDQIDDFVKPLIGGLKSLNDIESASSILLLLAVSLKTRSHKREVATCLNEKKDLLLHYSKSIHGEQKQVRQDMSHFADFLVKNARMIIMYEESEFIDMKNYANMASNEIVDYLKYIKDCWSSLHEMSCTPIVSVLGYNDLICYAFLEQSILYYKAFHLLKIAKQQCVDTTQMEFSSLKSQLTSYASKYWIQLTRNDNVQQDEYIQLIKQDESFKKHYEKIMEHANKPPTMKSLSTEETMSHAKAHLCHIIYNVGMTEFVSKRNKQKASDEKALHLETQQSLTDSSKQFFTNDTLSSQPTHQEVSNKHLGHNYQQVD